MAAFIFLTKSHLPNEQPTLVSSAGSVLHVPVGAEPSQGAALARGGETTDIYSGPTVCQTLSDRFLNPHSTSVGRQWLYTHFLDRETEAWRGKARLSFCTVWQ